MAGRAVDIPVGMGGDPVYHEPSQPDNGSLEELMASLANNNGLPSSSISSGQQSEAEEVDQEGDLNQHTLFHCVEEGNVKTAGALLKQKNVDLNALNTEGMTALHVAVLRYEKTRSSKMVEFLLESGADGNVKAEAPDPAARVSVLHTLDASPRRTPEGSPGVWPSDGGTLLERTQEARLAIDKKTPLLLALELKSAFYVRGWEYRHWDTVLELLASATVKQASQTDLEGATGGTAVEVHTPVPALLQRGWSAVFDSGAHEVVSIWAEGKELTVLKQIVYEASKVWRADLERTERTMLLRTGPPRLDLPSTPFLVLLAVMRFLYTGKMDDEFFKLRGPDILLLAHKYRVESLRQYSEAHMFIDADNWNRVLAAATQCGSSLLTLKCARSIKDTLVSRSMQRHMVMRRLSEEGPQQLFQKGIPSMEVVGEPSPRTHAAG